MAERLRRSIRIFFLPFFVQRFVNSILFRLRLFYACGKNFVKKMFYYTKYLVPRNQNGIRTSEECDENRTVFKNFLYFYLKQCLCLLLSAGRPWEKKEYLKTSKSQHFVTFKHAKKKEKQKRKQVRLNERAKRRRNDSEQRSRTRFCHFFLIPKFAFCSF